MCEWTQRPPFLGPVGKRCGCWAHRGGLAGIRRRLTDLGVTQPVTLHFPFSSQCGGSRERRRWRAEQNLEDFSFQAAENRQPRATPCSTVESRRYPLSREAPVTGPDSVLGSSSDLPNRFFPSGGRAVSQKASVGLRRGWSGLVQRQCTWTCGILVSGAPSNHRREWKEARAHGARRRQPRALLTPAGCRSCLPLIHAGPAPGLSSPFQPHRPGRPCEHSTVRQKSADPVGGQNPHSRLELWGKEGDGRRRGGAALVDRPLGPLGGGRIRRPLHRARPGPPVAMGTRPAPRGLGADKGRPSLRRTAGSHGPPLPFLPALAEAPLTPHKTSVTSPSWDRCPHRGAQRKRG